jgi:hypothetical protein
LDIVSAMDGRFLTAFTPSSNSIFSSTFSMSGQDRNSSAPGSMLYKNWDGNRAAPSLMDLVSVRPKLPREQWAVTKWWGTGTGVKVPALSRIAIENTGMPLTVLRDAGIMAYKGGFSSLMQPTEMTKGDWVLLGLEVAPGAGKVFGKVGGKIAPKLIPVVEKAVPLTSRGGTYVLRDVEGVIVRSGRTKDFARRKAEHARDPILGKFEFETVHKTDIYAEQRGLEQILHINYKPQLNKIGGISPKNPNAQKYNQAAQDYLQRYGDK